MSGDGYTIAPAACAEHPPLEEWPMKNLIQHVCPACGAWAYTNEQIGRMIRAQQLLRDREEGR